MDHKNSTIQDSSYQMLKRLVIDQTGIVFYEKREEELYHRVSASMKKWGFETFDAFLSALNLNSNTHILDDLISDLTIGETYFYRDQEVFSGLLNTVFPAIAKKNKQTRKIRIWCAGCATGEEPYTISMMLHHELSHQFSGWKRQIIGTDINRQFLSKAMEGIYGEWSFREILKDKTDICFEKIKNSYHIKSAYKKDVTFQYHNLVKHPFPSLFHNLANFDLILCRNVMIYFDKPTTRKIIEQFQKALVDEGWLIIGHADHFPNMFQKFLRVQTGRISFYQNAPPPKKIPAAPPQAKKKVKEHALSVQKINPPAPQDQKGVVRESPLITIAALVNQGDFIAANARCEAFIQKEPLNGMAHFYNGLALEQLGQISAAETAFKNVIYLDRESILGHYHLGLFYQNSKQFKPALKSFQNALHLLETTDDNHSFKAADHMSAVQLKELTLYHIEVLCRL